MEVYENQHNEYGVSRVTSCDVCDRPATIINVIDERWLCKSCLSAAIKAIDAAILESKVP